MAEKVKENILSGVRLLEANGLALTEDLEEPNWDSSPIGGSSSPEWKPNLLRSLYSQKIKNCSFLTSATLCSDGCQLINTAYWVNRFHFLHLEPVI